MNNITKILIEKRIGFEGISEINKSSPIAIQMMQNLTILFEKKVHGNIPLEDLLGNCFPRIHFSFQYYKNSEAAVAMVQENLAIL